MGYYTIYELSIAKGEADFEEVINKLNEIAGYMIFEDAESPYANAKWYECDKDMCKLSLQFPGVSFLLEGAGEEQPDLWRAYYRDGKSKKYTAKIIYNDENFDEDLNEDEQ